MLRESCSSYVGESTVTVVVEQTIPSMAAKTMILSSAFTCVPPHMDSYYRLVDQWSADVTEEDRKHDALDESRKAPDENSDDTDEKSVDPLRRDGNRTGNRVGHH